MIVGTVGPLRWRDWIAPVAFPGTRRAVNPDHAIDLKGRRRQAETHRSVSGYPWAGRRAAECALQYAIGSSLREAFCCLLLMRLPGMIPLHPLDGAFQRIDRAEE